MENAILKLQQTEIPPLCSVKRERTINSKKKMALRWITVLFALCYVANAFKLDMCRQKPPVKKDFDLSKLAGQWYEYAKLPNIFEYFNKLRCGTLEMTVDGDGLKFTTTFFNETSGKKGTMEGRLSVDAEKPGKIKVDLPAIGLSDYYSVVDAKYDDYFVLYFCDTLGIFRIEFGWVFTRQAELSEVRKESLVQTLKSLKIDTGRLQFENQIHC